MMHYNMRYMWLLHHEQQAIAFLKTMGINTAWLFFDICKYLDVFIPQIPGNKAGKTVAEA